MICTWVSHKLPVTLDKEYFITNVKLLDDYSSKYIPPIYYFYLPSCHLLNSATISLSQFGGKKLSTTPFFLANFQGIEGSTATKEVRHGVEQMLVGWRLKTIAICRTMWNKFNYWSSYFIFALMIAAVLQSRSIVILQKRMLSTDQGWITNHESGV